MEEFTVALAAVQEAKVAAAEVLGNKHLAAVLLVQEEIQAKPALEVMEQLVVQLVTILVGAAEAALTVEAQAELEEVVMPLFVIR